MRDYNMSNNYLWIAGLVNHVIPGGGGGIVIETTWYIFR